MYPYVAQRKMEPVRGERVRIDSTRNSVELIYHGVNARFRFAIEVEQVFNVSFGSATRSFADPAREQ